MTFADNLAARISDIDSRIQTTKSRAQAAVAALQNEKMVLLKAASLLSADAEQSLAALVDLGIISIRG